MAQVTSGKDMTVIVLDNDEASALTDVLDSHRNFDARLDELTNAMISYPKHITVDDKWVEPVTNWDKPEPPWKDEPSSDYRFGRG
mgnify:CR=1 FL=1